VDCIAPESRLFVQFTCIQDEPTLALKIDQLALIGMITTFISLMFLVQIRRLYQGGKITQLDWDMATITAGDYTVEFEIKEESYTAWYDSHYKTPGGDFEKGISAAYSMKVHLKKVVEEFLNQRLEFNRSQPDYVSRHALDALKKLNKKVKKVHN
jgi:hypothetical protein